MKDRIIRSTVKRILTNPFEYDWTIQGFGMLRLYLSERQRLHIWHSGKAVPEVSVMHTHPWDFTSYVVSGKILNLKYEECSETDGTNPTHHRGIVHCGEGGGLNSEFSLPQHMKQVEAINVTRGNTYSQKAEEVHVSRPDDGAVSIIERTFHKDTEHALVYWPIGTKWVSAEPRKATNEEILFFTTHAVDNWLNME